MQNHGNPTHSNASCQARYLYFRIPDVRARRGVLPAIIPWLHSEVPLPPLERALAEPNGLLAAGGDLSVPRLLEAYRRGIFPWFNPDEPILWWSPNPRMVLFPSEFKVSRSPQETPRPCRL